MLMELVYFQLENEACEALGVERWDPLRLASRGCIVEFGFRHG